MHKLEVYFRGVESPFALSFVNVKDRDNLMSVIEQGMSKGTTISITDKNGNLQTLLNGSEIRLVRIL